MKIIFEYKINCLPLDLTNLFHENKGGIYSLTSHEDFEKEIIEIFCSCLME